MLLVISVMLLAVACGSGDCDHADADDDNCCDFCGVKYLDGVDVLSSSSPCNHRDADDNGLCDKCKENYVDFVDLSSNIGHVHRDANDDNKCDSCGARFMDGPEDNTEPAHPVVIIDKESTEYRLVYGSVSGSLSASSAAFSLAEDVFYTLCGIDFDINPYKSSYGTENLIVVGKVDGISITERLANDVDSKPKSSFAFGIAYENGVLALYANSGASFNSAPIASFDSKPFFDDLAATLSLLIVEGKLEVMSNFYYVFELTDEEYNDLVTEDEFNCIDRRLEIKAERLDFLKEAVKNFDTADFGDELTTDFGKADTSPTAYPTAGEHPRILFTKDQIPEIRARLESDKNSDEYKQFMEYIDGDEFVTGILEAPALYPRGYYNWRGDVLAAIQANALAYALYGDEYYGYAAIYAIKNYLLTLEVDYIVSDACREFGMVMYIAACVYDWCYDLLSEEDKIQIPMGVEHKLCRGNMPNTMNGIYSTSSTIKMEMGFPPTGQHAVVGHGSEFQLLRDYLAMSIAVYDEMPGWYEFVAGRFYGEYVPVRQEYYGAGLYPQGTSVYGPWRFLADCFGAAIITTATGTNPFSTDMAQTLYTFLSHETKSGSIFRVGDGSDATFNGKKYGFEALILSYLFANTDEGAVLRSMADQLVDNYLEAWMTNVLCAEYFVFSSLDIDTSGMTDWHDELPLVCYNDGYAGQVIVRNGWGDNAAIAFMKIGEMTTANHDHEDAGTFQIYYKGLTTGTSGGYGSYGTKHWSKYHQATVSKNGMLIFNPADAGDPFYSGGQSTDGSEPLNLEDWQSGRYDRASVIGYACGYEADGVTPKYAYIAGDTTKAYSETQASYVGRSMFTVYTGDATVPMIMFVFDRVDAESSSFIKKFLLQVNGSNAPSIDETKKTVKLTNGKGRLVLQNVFGCDEIVAIGGGAGSNYVINGNQCADESFAEQNSWGRVELHSSGEKSSTMLNVLYVTDADNNDPVRVRSIVGYDKATDKEQLLEGASAMGTAMLFATEPTGLAEAAVFETVGKGDMTYYIGGLAVGEWNVYVDGELLCTRQSKGGEGFITFDATAGVSVTVEPVAQSLS